MQHRAAATATTDSGVGSESPNLQISITNLKKTFWRRNGKEVLAIDDVSLDVSRGEFVVLLGPSGCGKSTLLRCIAGLERPSAGEIVISNKLVSSADRGVYLPPEDRNISMMFQTYAVWPHMTAEQNVAYPLRVRGRSRSEIDERVRLMLKTVDLVGLGREYPGQLSGGQQQRVALARSLIVNPDVVLFDEPLSNVDARVRRSLRRELVAMQRNFSFASVYVTHDQEEAMEIADRVVLMRGGKISQMGTARQIYEQPNSRYAANFLGEINEIGGTVVALSTDPSSGRTLATVDTAAGMLMNARIVGSVTVADAVVVAARPHELRITPTDATQQASAQGSGGMGGRVIRQSSNAMYTEYLVETAGGKLTVWASKALPTVAPGATVRVELESDNWLVFSASESGLE